MTGRRDLRRHVTTVGDGTMSNKQFTVLRAFANLRRRTCECNVIQKTAVPAVKMSRSIGRRHHVGAMLAYSSQAPVRESRRRRRRRRLHGCQRSQKHSRCRPMSFDLCTPTSHETS
jgi:hypothetical protein